MIQNFINTIYYNVYSWMVGRKLFPERDAKNAVSFFFLSGIIQITIILFFKLNVLNRIPTFELWIASILGLYIPLAYVWHCYIIRKKAYERIIANAEYYRGGCGKLITLIFMVCSLFGGWLFCVLWDLIVIKH